MSQPSPVHPVVNSPSSAAWRSPSAWAWMLSVCVLAIVIDLGSKHLAFGRVADVPVEVTREQVLAVIREKDARAISPELVPQHDPVVVVPEVLHFTLVLNPGAVFGIGPGQRMFFVGFTVLALGFGLLMFARWTGPRDHFAHAAIGLLIGGGLGNLYDRLQYACVRDFLHPLPGWRWPFGLSLLGGREVWPYVSNLADLFLLVGIAMLLAHLWKRDRAEDRARAAAKRPPAVTA